jgi:hypothetical protein
MSQAVIANNKSFYPAKVTYVNSLNVGFNNEYDIYTVLDTEYLEVFALRMDNAFGSSARFRVYHPTLGVYLYDFASQVTFDYNRIAEDLKTFSLTSGTGSDLVSKKLILPPGSVLRFQAGPGGTWLYNIKLLGIAHRTSP